MAFKHISNNHHRGFTLLELMIALAVFSILSVMAYSGLGLVLNSRDHTIERADRLVELQTAFNMMERDIEQAINRPITSKFGSTAPAFMFDDFNPIFLNFTRGGVPNPMQRPRSNMQRVGYELDDEVLSRVLFLNVDQGVDAEPLSRKLIDRVKSVRHRYMDDAGQWQEVWPPIGVELKPDYLPRAIDITLKLDDIGEVRRVFRLANGRPPSSKKTDENNPNNPNNPAPN